MNHLAKLATLALAPIMGYLIYNQTFDLGYAFLAFIVTLAIVSRALTAEPLK